MKLIYCLFVAMIAFMNLETKNASVPSNDPNSQIFHVFSDSIDVKIIKSNDSASFKIRIVNYNKLPIYLEADYFFWGSGQKLEDSIHFSSICNDPDSYPTEHGIVNILKIGFKDTTMLRLRAPKSDYITFPTDYFTLLLCFYKSDGTYNFESDSIETSVWLWLLNTCFDISNF